MDIRNRMLVLLLLSFFISLAVGHQQSGAASNDDDSEDLSKDNNYSSDTNNSPQIQRRSGAFHSGLSYHLPASTGFAYAAKPYYTTPVKYPVFKTFAATPLLRHHHPVHTYAAHPHYQLQHGGASVSSYNVNYPRYPLYRHPLLKVPTTTVVKPTVFSAVAPSYAFPAPVYPSKPIIPIAINPVLPTAARPFVYPQPAAAFNPAILAGLNPSLIPVSVSNGAVFANYPTLAPTPLGPSSWRPIAVPTIPTTISVQRPSISILPPLGAPSSTVGSLADPIYHHHHQFPAQQFPVAPTVASSPVLSDSFDNNQHNQHHHHHLFASSGGCNDKSRRKISFHGLSCSLSLSLS